MPFDKAQRAPLLDFGCVIRLVWLQHLDSQIGYISHGDTHAFSVGRVIPGSV